jgi:opacity protein-like surface antigen
MIFVVYRVIFVADCKLLLTLNCFLMKKLLAFFAVSLLCVGLLQAQVDFGVKGGMGISKYTISSENSSLSIAPGNKIGFYLGGVVNYELSDKFGLQTELLYEYGGARLMVDRDLAEAYFADWDEGIDVSGDLKVCVNTHSVTIPVLVKFQTTEGLSLLGGVYASYRVKSNVKFNNHLSALINGFADEEDGDIANFFEEGVDQAFDDNVEKLNYGLSIGAEYKLKNGFFVDARFNQPLNNLWKGEDIDAGPLKPTLKQSSIFFGVGFRF